MRKGSLASWCTSMRSSFRYTRQRLIKAWGRRVRTHLENNNTESQPRPRLREERATCLSFRCDYWLRRKLHIGRLQDGVLLEDVLLRLVMPKGLRSKRTNCQ